MMTFRCLLTMLEINNVNTSKQRDVRIRQIFRYAKIFIIFNFNVQNRRIYYNLKTRKIFLHEACPQIHLTN